MVCQFVDLGSVPRVITKKFLIRNQITKCPGSGRSGRGDHGQLYLADRRGRGTRLRDADGKPAFLRVSRSARSDFRSLVEYGRAPQRQESPGTHRQIANLR